MAEIDLFITGRLCLFGEHSDWAGEYRKIDPSIVPGYCITVGTDQGIYATVKPHPSQLIITSTLPDGKKVGPARIPMADENLLKIASEGGFFSYCAGVAYCLLQWYPVKGLSINNYKTDLPIKKGLSSSASICVLVARAFNLIYGLNLSLREEMELAYQGEILTPSKCGRMDQVCVFGKTPAFLTFDGDSMEVELLSPKKPIFMVIVDLKKGKNTQKILADLNYHFSNKKDKISQNLRYYLGEVNQRILFKAKEAINAGDAKEIGLLMKEAQRLFDELVQPASPEELASPKLHYVLEYPKIQDLIYGGKGVGSQGDGSAQFVVKGPEEQKIFMERIKELDVECFPLTIQPKTEEN